MMNSEPDFEAAIGLVNHLSTDELKELMNDEDKVMNLVKDLPQIKNLEVEKDLLLTTTKSAAEYNLSLQPKINERMLELISKYEDYASLQEEFNNLKKEKDQSITKQSPEAVQAILQTAAKEKENETDSLVRDFLNSDETQADSFVSTFISERTIAHSRNIKAEKMTELLVQKRNNQNKYPASIVTTPWATPYPTQLPNMPLARFDAS